MSDVSKRIATIAFAPCPVAAAMSHDDVAACVRILSQLLEVVRAESGPATVP